MKKAVLSFGLMSLALLFSCKKSETAKPKAADVSTTETDADSKLRANLYNSGGTAALTHQPNGSYTANWGGADLVFTGIPTPTSNYKFGDGINGYTVQCTNGTIVSTGSSYFVGSINVMSQADVDFILIRTNGYITRMFDYTNKEKHLDGTFKQPNLPNFYNEVMVPYTGNSAPFSGGVIYDPGVLSHLTIAPSSFVATVANTAGELLYLGELYKGNIRLEFYSNTNASHHLTRIDAFDASGNQLDVYSVGGIWETVVGSGGVRVTGSIVVGNSNSTPITFLDMIYFS